MNLLDRVLLISIDLRKTYNILNIPQLCMHVFLSEKSNACTLCYREPLCFRMIVFIFENSAHGWDQGSIDSPQPPRLLRLHHLETSYG